MPLRNQNAETPDDSSFGQMRDLWRIIHDPKSRRSLTLSFAAITLVIAANAVVQIRLNTWQGNIYDAISQRDVSIFLQQIGLFILIVSILLCLGVAQTWLYEMLKVRLRQAVTYDMLDEWLKPLRAFQLPLSGEISANPDQRIQDDTRRLSELSVDLAVGLVQSSLLLLAFVGVLWELSSHVVFQIDGKPIMIPGYMVWCAIGYSLLGSLLTWVVGRPLISAHTALRAEEADFRFSLVRVNEASEQISLFRGEARERGLLNSPVDAVLSTMRRIANRLAVLTWVTGGYGWLTILAPLLLAAPGYFGRTLSLGGLMMVVGAFYQVQQALRWYVDKFPAIAEWRAMLARVISCRSALAHLDSLGADVGRIQYDADHADAFSMENLCVFAPNGRISLSEQHVKIEPGERVLIEAPRMSGKTIFLNALAGLWRWGSGTIRLPSRHRIMFLPQAPYVPAGSLREAIAYPDAADRYSDVDIRNALERVQLGQFCFALDAVKRWDKELSLDEQRRFILGRMLLFRPQWIIQDESLSELDEESRKVALSIFASELAHSTIVSVGHHDPRFGFYQRTLSLQTKLPRLRLPLKFQTQSRAS